MIERRKDRRSASDLSGIVFYSQRTLGDCLICDTSAFGARITFQTAAPLPQVFELHVPHQRAHYRAYTKWRKDRQAGIKLERLVAPQRQHHLKSQVI